MRIVFAGTPDPAVPSLTAIAQSDHDLVGVVTRTDAPLGRKRVLTPSPVATAAADLGVPIVKADRLGDDATASVAALEPDLGVIVAYGGLVREPLLSVPRHGWINLHFSLLPRWRGAAPIHRAIEAGDTETGITIMQMDEGLDTGAMLLREAVTNIVRHAKASEVRVSLTRTPAGHTLTIHDNGIGGDAPEGTGLNSMRERLRAIGGTLERDGRQGTCLSAHFPAEERAAPTLAEGTLADRKVFS